MTGQQTVVPIQSHLARVTPINPNEACRVMSTFSLIRNATKLVLFQTSWILFAIAGAVAIASDTHLVALLGLASWSVAVAMMLGQFCLVFVYPEWPINLSLCRSLRVAVANRSDRADWADERCENRIVELVPRDRWSKASLDTATDLLLIRIDEYGIQLEGDCDRYELPCESILGAELVSMRPPGWFTSTNMVVITVKTLDGPIELPIAYRDHRFGSLRNSRRRLAAIKLTEQINRIAVGSDFQLSVPIDAVDELRPVSMNPYASPRT